MYPYEWTLETDCRDRSHYLRSPSHWQLGIRLKIQRPNSKIFQFTADSASLLFGCVLLSGFVGEVLGISR